MGGALPNKRIPRRPVVVKKNLIVEIIDILVKIVLRYACDGGGVRIVPAAEGGRAGKCRREG